MNRHLATVLALLLIILPACNLDLVSSGDKSYVSVRYQLGGGIAGILHEMTIYANGNARVKLISIPGDRDFTTRLSQQQLQTIKTTLAIALPQLPPEYTPDPPVADDFSLVLTLTDRNGTTTLYTAEAMYNAPEGYQRIQTVFEQIIQQLIDKTDR